MGKTGRKKDWQEKRKKERKKERKRKSQNCGISEPRDGRSNWQEVAGHVELLIFLLALSHNIVLVHSLSCHFFNQRSMFLFPVILESEM